ncbi:antitoxin (DNA-binding transcriptional repressor) of toxin-antitoxin stability system [Bradyrhizobium sp. GM22.5]
MLDENTAQGSASSRIVSGRRSAVQRPSTPKNTSAQEKSAHWWKAIPARIALHDGSALIAQSRAGMAATVIQSTAASRPMRAAKSWLTMVEKVLLIRPSSAAATQRERRREAPSSPVRIDLEMADGAAAFTSAD